MPPRSPTWYSCVIIKQSMVIISTMYISGLQTRQPVIKIVDILSCCISDHKWLFHIMIIYSIPGSSVLGTLAGEGSRISWGLLAKIKPWLSSSKSQHYPVVLLSWWRKCTSPGKVRQPPASGPRGVLELACLSHKLSKPVNHWKGTQWELEHRLAPRTPLNTPCREQSSMHKAGVCVCVCVRVKVSASSLTAKSLISHQ